MPESSKDNIVLVNAFFGRAVSRRGTKPLKQTVLMALYIDESEPLSLVKRDGFVQAEAKGPDSPDLSFWAPRKALEQLQQNPTEDLGELGVGIVKLMAHPDPNFRIRTKVHIGIFELMRKGYLSIIPLGGTTLMKFLASRGLTGIGKIRTAIQSLRK